MQDAAQVKVYRGYTADELALSLDVQKTVDNLPAIQQEDGQRSAATREKLGGVIDVPYGAEELQKLDIFAPEGADGAPVLFYIHGGGWRSGTKNSMSFTAEALNAKGVVYVPIDYGLAPDYTVEQMVDHVRSALAWVYGHVREHGGDPDQIYVAGNSAGGHFTGTLLMPGWQPEYGVPHNVVKGACAMSGVFDMEAYVHASFGCNEQMAMDVETARRFSPYYHLPRQTPPPLIIGYGRPELVEFKRQSTDFAKAWREAGFPVTEIEVPDAHHFEMPRQLANPESEMHRAVMEMMGTS